MSQPTVLIAGSGPAGLILAITLLKNGVPVRLIDKESKHRIGSRGAGVQPRTLELYDILGVLPNIQKAADPDLPRRRMYELPGGTTVVKELPWLTGSSPILGRPTQEIHEEILRGYLVTLGGAVELGTELHAFEQFPDGVVAQIVKTAPNGRKSTETTKFGWLVGTDGVHSVVRKQLGLTFLGETKEDQHVVVGDIVVQQGLDRGFWHYWIPPSKMMVLRSGTAATKSYRFAYTGVPEHWKQTPPTGDEFVEEFYDVTGRRDIEFGATTWISSFKSVLSTAGNLATLGVFDHY